MREAFGQNKYSNNNVRFHFAPERMWKELCAIIYQNNITQVEESYEYLINKRLEKNIWEW